MWQNRQLNQKMSFLCHKDKNPGANQYLKHQIPKIKEHKQARTLLKLKSKH